MIIGKFEALPQTQDELSTLLLFRDLKAEIDSYLPPSAKITNFQLVFFNSPTIAGICLGRCHNIIGICKEYISAPTTSMYNIKMTLLHELSHAILDNHHGHNDIWKQVNQIIGGDGEEFCEQFCNKRYVIACPHGCFCYRDRLHKKVWANKGCAEHKAKYTVFPLEI